MSTHYRNLWRNEFGAQWVDHVGHHTDRDFCNRVAELVHAENVHIRRVCLIRVTPKVTA